MYGGDINHLISRIHNTEDITNKAIKHISETNPTHIFLTTAIKQHYSAFSFAFKNNRVIILVQVNAIKFAFKTSKLAIVFTIYCIRKCHTKHSENLCAYLSSTTT